MKSAENVADLDHAHIRKYTVFVIQRREQAGKAPGWFTYTLFLFLRCAFVKRKMFYNLYYDK